MQDLAGNSPLHFAAKYGNLELCKYLIERGTQVYVKNKANQTAYDVAEDHHMVRQFLLPLVLSAERQLFEASNASMGAAPPPPPMGLGMMVGTGFTYGNTANNALPSVGGGGSSYGAPANNFYAPAPGVAMQQPTSAPVYQQSQYLQTSTAVPSAVTHGNMQLLAPNVAPTNNSSSSSPVPPVIASSVNLTPGYTPYATPGTSSKGNDRIIPSGDYELN